MDANAFIDGDGTVVAEVSHQIRNEVDTMAAAEDGSGGGVSNGDNGNVDDLAVPPLRDRSYMHDDDDDDDDDDMEKEEEDDDAYIPQLLKPDNANNDNNSSITIDPNRPTPDKVVLEYTYPQDFDGQLWVVVAATRQYFRLLIDPSCTEIESRIFDNCAFLIEVVFLDGCTIHRIGEDAFCRCRNLQRIKLPEGLKFMGPAAFRDCSSLIEILIPSTVAAIGSHCFSYCDSLRRVRFADSVTAVELNVHAFNNCVELRSVQLPRNLSIIPHYCFSGCIALVKVPIPVTVREIQSYSFSDCKSLESIDLSENIIIIEDKAYAGCAALQKVTIRSTKNLRIGERIFFDCPALSSMTVLPLFWPKLFQSMNRNWEDRALTSTSIIKRTKNTIRKLGTRVITTQPCDCPRRDINTIAAEDEHHESFATFPFLSLRIRVPNPVPFPPSPVPVPATTTVAANTTTKKASRKTKTVLKTRPTTMKIRRKVLTDRRSKHGRFIRNTSRVSRKSIVFVVSPELCNQKDEETAVAPSAADVVVAAAAVSLTNRVGPPVDVPGFDHVNGQHPVYITQNRAQLWLEEQQKECDLRHESQNNATARTIVAAAVVETTATTATTAAVVTVANTKQSKPTTRSPSAKKLAGSSYSTLPPPPTTTTTTTTAAAVPRTNRSATADEEAPCDDEDKDKKEETIVPQQHRPKQQQQQQQQQQHQQEIKQQEEEIKQPSNKRQKRERQQGINPSWTTRETPPWKGLHNSGNNFCYMNAGLQLLFSAPKFMQAIAITNNEDNICSVLSALWMALMDRTPTSVLASAQPVRDLMDVFERYRVHDGDEFIKKLLDSLPVPVVDKFFGWIVRRTLKCTSCGCTRVTDDSEQCLPIVVGDGGFDRRDLPYYVNDHFRQEGEFDYTKCPECNVGKTVKQTSKIMSQPKVLLIHLIRNRFVGGRDCKINDPVEFTPSFSFDNDLFESEITIPRQYRLKSTMHHIGNQTDSGHYTANAIRPHNGNEQWVLFNDEVTVERSIVDIFQSIDNQKTAYMFLYECEEEQHPKASNTTVTVTATATSVGAIATTSNGPPMSKACSIFKAKIHQVTTQENPNASKDELEQIKNTKYDSLNDNERADPSYDECDDHYEYSSDDADHDDDDNNDDDNDDDSDDYTDEDNNLVIEFPSSSPPTSAQN